MAEIKRPSNVPEDAQWGSGNKIWFKGSSTANGERDGKWTYWYKSGVLSKEDTYQRGTLHGDFSIYHKEGTVAQEGTRVNGKIDGWVECYKSRTNKKHSSFPREYSQNIQRARVFYSHGTVLKWVYYDRKNRVVDTYARVRPSKVGNNAFWSQAGYTWQEGDFKTGTKDKTGTWKTWTWDGVLDTELVYGDNNQLHGNYKQYHNDGTIAHEGLFQNGKRHGEHRFLRAGSYTRHNHFSGVNAKVWRQVIYYNNGVQGDTHYYTKDNKRCSRKGFELIDADVNDLFNGNPENFLDDNFTEYLYRFTGSLEAYDAMKDQKRRDLFQTLWGTAMPDVLAKSYNVISRLKSDTQLFNMYEPAIPKFDQLEDWMNSGKNIVEQAILGAQEDYPYDHLIDWFTGSVALDPLLMNPEQQYNSYSYHYGLNDGVIYLHRHQGYNYWSTSFDNAFARDLSSFFYYSCLFSAYGEYDLINVTKFQENVGKLHNKLKFPYYFLGDFRVASNRRINESSFNYNTSNRPVLNAFNKAKWVLEFLRGETDINTVKSSIFRRALQAKHFTTQQHSTYLRNIQTGSDVPTALYLLFGTYLVKDCDAYMHDYINAAKQNPSRIIQDAARLVEELANGRNSLGIITDLDHLKRQFNR